MICANIEAANMKPSNRRNTIKVVSLNLAVRGILVRSWLRTAPTYGSVKTVTSCLSFRYTPGILNNEFSISDQTRFGRFDSSKAFWKMIVLTLTCHSTPEGEAKWLFYLQSTKNWLFWQILLAGALQTIKESSIVIVDVAYVEGVWVVGYACSNRITISQYSLSVSFLLFL